MLDRSGQQDHASFASAFTSRLEKFINEYREQRFGHQQINEELYCFENDYGILLGHNGISRICQFSTG